MMRSYHIRSLEIYYSIDVAAEQQVSRLHGVIFSNPDVTLTFISVPGSDRL